MLPSASLRERKLPALPDRETIFSLLSTEEYGVLPETDVSVEVSEPKILDARICAGEADVSRVDFTFSSVYGTHTFPVYRVLHHDGKKRPFFVHPMFHTGAENLCLPMEEIADRGYNVLAFYHIDVTADNCDFSDGLAKVLLPNGQDTPHTAGKLRIWAYAASRILDYAGTLPGLDLSQAAVMGHSRLGKTALVAGLFDSRFRYVISNDSGCCGAALARGNTGLAGNADFSGGETVKDIVDRFPFWFAPAFYRYAQTNIPDAFDQHFLLASIAPRFVYVASADMDAWADPASEFLSCVAASSAFTAMGTDGLIAPDAFPAAGDFFHEGRVGYHLRHGKHFLSRYDWNQYMDYIDRHKNDIL
ncbi:MAG: hypothetical protein MJ078_01035 [Clostridia bacterium]|nr:hypothetical protein [Clostridia bacterium]